MLRRTAWLLSVVALLAFSGCAARGPLIEPSSRSIELEQTPFFAQTRYQCGPAALAMLLVSAGVSVSPEELVPQVYLPGRQGSLTIEMQAAPRRYGRVSYPVAPQLSDLLAQLDAGRPVLVLHNYGLPFWPRWHYAVLIGYDAASQRMLLRSGTTRRLPMSAASFMRAWDNADRWAQVLLRPGELPAHPAFSEYLEAVTAFERAARPEDARRTYDAAITQWPDAAVAWVGRGTARYRAGALREAALDYHHALQLDPALAGARNNLAMTLLELGCPASARREMQQIDIASLQDPLRAAATDTARQIDAHGSAIDGSACSLY
jgi:hypothetical protein